MIIKSSFYKEHNLFKTLFHIMFWCMWILFPIVMFYNVLDRQQIPWRFVLINIFLIPLFYINSDFLIPKVFEKKGLVMYILSLIFFIVVFYVINILFELYIDPSKFGGLNRLRPITDIPPDLGPPPPGGKFGRNPNSFRFWQKPVFPILLIVMVSTIYGLFDHLVREEHKKKEKNKEQLKSELSFLRSQVSPHFLLNTLNSVLYLVRTKSSKAEDLVLKLSDIIKYMIYECNNNEVHLHSEVQYIKNYIELQNVRFGEDVRIVFECDGNFDNYMIEPMLMIPYVENAFKHGTAAILNPEINISISMIDGLLKLDVRNKYQDVTMAREESGGIGLENVKRRLEILYPFLHKLEQGVENDWYVVHLELKLETS